MKKTILSLAAVCMLAATGVSANEPFMDSNLDATMITAQPSIFCKAIMQGDVDTVRKMIQLGEDVNQKSLGMTPIHFAARYNQTEILQLLIDNGANVKKRCDRGYSAKKYAEMANAKEALAILEDAMKK
ncbi:ankyrin repeat domain-containing protein [Flagellimonas olearia]|uniref:Ankyrin n=1 Tax=Flagellimonas olearia TaxID=552546 RepID=A0A444VJJ2_9FLAO|nr:ankyrin repeat domain-containing protein [Allomuricauda olearia]KAB7529464.1 ankyrin repeat domain-containing protein [Allomuricauda olearia]RYC50938.1 ankyrin [Allomuricauda olearia]